jgi:hypothetical protein
MNDEFESRVKTLARTISRDDPTPDWKSEILAKARREASFVQLRTFLPPRWLAVGWAAAWTGILLLGWSAHSTSQQIARAIPPTSPSRKPLSRPAESLTANLSAFERHLTLGVELQ